MKRTLAKVPSQGDAPVETSQGSPVVPGVMSRQNSQRDLYNGNLDGYHFPTEEVVDAPAAGVPDVQVTSSQVLGKVSTDSGWCCGSCVVA